MNSTVIENPPNFIPSRTFTAVAGIDEIGAAAGVIAGAGIGAGCSTAVAAGKGTPDALVDTASLDGTIRIRTRQDFVQDT